MTQSQLTQFQSECINFFGDVAQGLGVAKSIGQIYGVIYASRESVSFTDIVALLNISKGSVSQGLQFLRSLGAVNVSERLNDRREYFECELGLRRLVGGLMREKIDPLLSSGRLRIAQLENMAREATDPSLRKFQIDRVKQLRAWRTQFALVIPLVHGFLRSPRK